jgi:hypothetical protein
MAVVPLVAGSGISAENPMPITGEVTGIEIAEVTVSVGETAVSAEAPFPTADAATLGAVEDVVAGIGATDDAAVIDPALAGSLIALLKGLLTEISLMKADLTDVKTATETTQADIALVKADVSDLKDDVADLKAATGSTADAAIINPEASATLVSASKGILTELALLKAATGTATDAAVTNPALDATVIAALKGIITNTTPAG